MNDPINQKLADKLAERAAKRPLLRSTDESFAEMNRRRAERGLPPIAPVDRRGRKEKSDGAA